MIYKRYLTGSAPADQNEFEAAVAATLRTMALDGSVYISHNDICYYNNWQCTAATSRRIGILLKNKMALIRVNSRNTYRLPEVA